jgi:hypothetical protein
VSSRFFFLDATIDKPALARSQNPVAVKLAETIAKSASFQ